MKVYWKMPAGLHNSYSKELTLYYVYLKEKNLPLAWRQLERAHILGQPSAIEHTEVHWIMLKFGFRIKSWREILGQIPCLLAGGVKSFVGKTPVGNTGGANVPPLRPMGIPADLKQIMKSYVNF